MVLDRYRHAADRVLVPIARRLIGVNPDAVSWLAFMAAIGAGLAFYLGGPRFPGLALVLGERGREAAFYSRLGRQFVNEDPGALNP